MGSRRQPNRAERSRIALRISRRFTLGLRQHRAGYGRSDLIRSHSSPVRSVAPRLKGRLALTMLFRPHPPHVARHYLIRPDATFSNGHLQA